MRCPKKAFDLGAAHRRLSNIRSLERDLGNFGSKEFRAALPVRPPLASVVLCSQSQAFFQQTVGPGAQRCSCQVCQSRSCVPWFSRPETSNGHKAGGLHRMLLSQPGSAESQPFRQVQWRLNAFARTAPETSEDWRVTRALISFKASAVC